MSRVQRLHFAPLDCIVVDGGLAPRIAVVICHGYGASYDDLAPLSQEWLGMLGEAGEAFRFVFPDAPHSLVELGFPQGRAWWPINMSQLAEAVQAERFEELHDHEPPGMELARKAFGQCVTAIQAELGGADVPLVLGGFSQGAMLTMDFSLRGEVAPPQLLLQFSGTVVCRSQWQSRMLRLADSQVYQSHGRFDPILPFDSALALRDMIQAAEVPVEFHAFDGPHTIDTQAVVRTAQLLGSLVAERSS